MELDQLSDQNSKQHISTFSSINGAVSHSFTFKRLSSRFDIGVRFLVILGGGVSSVKVNVDVGRFDFVSLLNLRLCMSEDMCLKWQNDTPPPQKNMLCYSASA